MNAPPPDPALVDGEDWTPVEDLDDELIAIGDGDPEVDYEGSAEVYDALRATRTDDEALAVLTKIHRGS